MFIPLPNGVDMGTQVEDGELFDFDIEVEPILQSLVGRSLVQARYELIEDHERHEYLIHKKKYDQKREFELMKLQRMEAGRIRREEEKARRERQVMEKRQLEVLTQQKLMCKVFSKVHLGRLKELSLNHLYEAGYLQ